MRRKVGGTPFAFLMNQQYNAADDIVGGANKFFAVAVDGIETESKEEPRSTSGLQSTRASSCVRWASRSQPNTAARSAASGWFLRTREPLPLQFRTALLTVKRCEFEVISEANNSFSLPFVFDSNSSKHNRIEIESNQLIRLMISDQLSVLGSSRGGRLGVHGLPVQRQIIQHGLVLGRPAEHTTNLRVC